MKMVTLSDDSQESINFSLMNTIPSSVCIFILMGYFLFRWSLRDDQRLDVKKKKVLSLIEQKQSSNLK